MVHDLEHVNIFEPFLDFSHNFEIIFSLTVLFELDKLNCIHNLWNFDVNVIDIKAL